MKIQINRDGERYGPYSIEDVNSYLANGTLLPSDNAWHDGMPDWVPIGQIQGVILPSGGALTQQPTPEGEVTASKGGNRTLWISLGAVAVIGLAVGGAFLFYPKQTSDDKTPGAGEKAGRGGVSAKKDDSLSMEIKKVIGVWNRIDNQEFETKDDDTLGNYEFFANGEMAKNKGTMIENTGKWELKNHEIVVTYTGDDEPLGTHYFEIDEKGILKATKVKIGGQFLQGPSNDAWSKVK